MYYFTLRGKIPTFRQCEFEGTISLVSSQLPVGCAGHGLYKDGADPDIYKFVSYWHSIEDLEVFKKSAEFIILTTAYSTPGQLLGKFQGGINEAPIFQE